MTFRKVFGAFAFFLIKKRKKPKKFIKSIYKPKKICYNNTDEQASSPLKTESRRRIRALPVYDLRK